MKANHVRSSATLKLFLGVLLATCFLVTTAHAKPFYSGTFQLTNEVQWGKSVLPPGTYSLVLDQLDPSTRTITIRDARTGKLIVCELARIDHHTDNEDSKLLIAVGGNQRAVYSLWLAGMGEVFQQTRPLGENKRTAQEARNTEAVPIQLAKN